MNPLVSVIIPTYNRKTLITECLDSILSQTYQPLEIIVVDDGSTDGTVPMLKEQYGDSIVIIQLAHSGLPAVARNAGVQQARGEFIAFCDSDDVWQKNKIEKQIHCVVNEGKNFVCTDALFLGEQNRYLEHVKFRYNDLRKELLWNNYVITSSVLLSASLIKTMNFNTSSILRGYEDYALWLRLADTLNIQFLSQPLVFYRRHAQSLSSNVRKLDARIQLVLILKFISPIRHPFIFLKKLAKYCYYFIQ